MRKKKIQPLSYNCFVRDSRVLNTKFRPIWLNVQNIIFTFEFLGNIIELLTAANELIETTLLSIKLFRMYGFFKRNAKLELLALISRTFE